ncbi:MAG: UDP-N-acetylglucosamine--N-acetylmuramyl-(pentapeptide) pyrophosphoryl-undecaprenol N-acetylglucosamine transferase [Deltaproteobacteria bacterium]|nr:UDP-N-acetylglucosamine--N-acetylmuramyl-(pentapeptide) pyrophosphoryl-undecaprenol N-acetylglucosamine transferase [Deltaproteobacteria bacterium]
MSSADLFVCGGGTGGHFFSGLALAEKYLQKNPQARVVFVGTKNGIEARFKLSDPRMSVKFIAAKGVKGKGLIAKFQAIFFLILGFFESLSLLFSLKPKLVYGVGGYASVPTVFAAILFKMFGGWEVGVLEQNSSAGLANKIFSKLTKKSYAAFPCSGFELVDLPLRSEFLAQASRARTFSWPPKVIFVLGGSQGASGINNRWIEMLSEIKKIDPKMHFIHQSGIKDFENLKKTYADLNLSAEVFAFSNEMPKFYDQADLMVCRSGAMTVFEIMAFKRPCVFIPFPAATDDHQKKNALSVQDPAWVIDEKNFNWNSFQPILTASSPKIPNRASVNREII